MSPFHSICRGQLECAATVKGSRASDRFRAGEGGQGALPFCNLEGDSLEGEEAEASAWVPTLGGGWTSHSLALICEDPHSPGVRGQMGSRGSGKGVS